MSRSIARFLSGPRFLVTNVFAMALLYVQSLDKTPELLSLNSAVRKLLI